MIGITSKQIDEEYKAARQSCISPEMIDAYISAVQAAYRGEKEGSLELVRKGLEAAISVQAFGVRDAVKQTQELYADEPMAIDALNYLHILIQCQGR